MLSCDVSVALNRFVLRVSAPRTDEVGRVELLDGDGEIPLLLHPETAEAGAAHRLRTFNKQNLLLTYVSQQPFARSAVSALLGKPLQVRVAQAEGSQVLRSRPNAMSLQQVAELEPGVLDALSSDDDVKAIVAALRKGRIDNEAPATAFVDYAYRNGNALFLNGWMPNFSSQKVFFFTLGCAFMARGSEGVSHPRPDVSEHLRAAGHMVSNDGHGFSIMLDAVPQDSQVLIYTLVDGTLRLCYSGTPEFSADPSRLYQLMGHAHQTGGHLPLTQITSQVAPFLAQGSITLDHDVVQRARWVDGQGPRLSVIVPFYREWRFIFSILTMVRNGPADWEWVIVCDDGAIFQPLGALIAAQEPAVKARITLVLPRRNVGYGHANNLGVGAAQAPLVLLMNSDIWVADFAPITDAMAAVADRAYALVGFTLLFEDNTVQHDGLAFRRSGEVNGMYLALHPGKGLPPRPDLPQSGIGDTGSVTGALMLLRKDRYEALGGFSERYIGGDFEDADLCLSLVAEGERIGIARSRSIFHLERQSIRKDAANSLATMRTLVNCERFNGRWAASLDVSNGNVSI